METKRLIIRRFKPGDICELTEIIRDKMASRYAKYDEQFPTDEISVRGILDYFIGTDEFYALELKDGNRVIGFLSLNRIDDCTRNFGICIHGTYQHRGYAAEAAQKMLLYAKDEMKLNKLVSGTAEDNTPACALLERCGFTLSGKEQTSFATDTEGKPILFTGCLFERKL